MGKLFGTNGVRGVVNRELTVEKVIRLSASAGSFLGKHVAVGMDGRTSSPMFRDAAASGLLSVGCTVHDAGTLPTPTLQFSVRHFNLDGGLMITASHNPPEYNGVKVMAKDGVEISRGNEEEIEKTFFKGGPRLSPWDEIGSIKKINVLEPYRDTVLSHVDSEKIRRAGLKIAVDPGNGVAALTAPVIAGELCRSVYTVNIEVDGCFPSRDSEPRPDNLDALTGLVCATGSDGGVAFDGDGDRAIFVDEKGEVHWGDRSFALIAKDLLSGNPGVEVATPVSSSQVLKDVVEEGKGRILWTRVGSVDVSRAMVDGKIMLGGEENGGVMYGPHLEVRDGSMAMALILEIMAKREAPLSHLFGELPEYAQMKDKVECPEEFKGRVLDSLKERVEASKIDSIDGVKLWFDDGSWILIRPSGTEEIFRLYAEAKSQETVEKLMEEHMKIVTSLVESLR